MNEFEKLRTHTELCDLTKTLQSMLDGNFRVSSDTLIHLLNAIKGLTEHAWLEHKALLEQLSKLKKETDSKKD